MTSLAFIAGVVPLVIARGAGAEMRHVMGVAVFSGMLGVTLFGLVFTPLFYVIIRGLVERRAAKRAADGTPDDIRPLRPFERPFAVAEGDIHHA
jgi:multidrug efflux pump